MIRPFIVCIVVVLAFFMTLGYAQPPSSQPVPAPSSAPASRAAPSRQPSSAQANIEGVWDFQDDSGAIALKLCGQDKTFVLTVRATKDSGDRFALAGISGLGKGESSRVISGPFTVSGIQILLTATSGIFERSKDGLKMTFILAVDGNTVTNTKGLRLRRQPAPAASPVPH